MSSTDMLALGISGRRRDAAAALAMNGRIVAAATEETLSRIPRVGYAHTGGFPHAAAAACLERVGATAHDVAIVAVASRMSRRADDVPPVAAPCGVRQIDPLRAQAVHVAAASAATSVLVIVVEPGAAPSGAVFERRGRTLRRVAAIPGLVSLFQAARRLARQLGEDPGEPCEALERLAAGGEALFQAAFVEAITWAPGTGIVVDDARLAQIGAAAAADCPGSLADPASGHVRVEERRRALAAGFRLRLAQIIRDLATHACETRGVSTIGAGGGLFGSSDLNSRLRHAIGAGFYVGPVPESAGRALGTALSVADGDPGGAGRCLALGPEFSESQVKATLESCRLDYLYEPDWERLRTRVSQLLGRGKLVAWFQGPMDFGPRSLGSRSILCDPSHRYARENVNRYLRQRTDDPPLPVSLTERAAGECLDPFGSSPFMSFRASAREAWRLEFRAALDRDASFTFHTVTADQSPQLCALLETHRRRTGVPGLVNVPLKSPGEPIACTPRDAIRVTFGSAVDALVMGRFLLMKDYWLLRSDSDA